MMVRVSLAQRIERRLWAVINRGLRAVDGARKQAVWNIEWHRPVTSANVVRVALATVVLLVPMQANAAIAIVQSVSAGSSDTGDSVTTAAVDTTGANGIVCAVADFTSPAATISDSKSNTYTGLTRQDAGAPAIRLYYVANPTVGSGHTFTASNTDSFPSIACLALSGTNTTTFYDGTENGAVDNTASSQSIQPGSVTPSEDNTIVVTAFGVYSSGTGHTINGSYTIEETVTFGPGEHIGVVLAYWIQTTATATNPTWSWTTNDYAATVIAPFRSSGGGGPSCRGGLLLLGVGGC